MNSQQPLTEQDFNAAIADARKLLPRLRRIANDTHQVNHKIRNKASSTAERMTETLECTAVATVPFESEADHEC